MHEALALLSLVALLAVAVTRPRRMPEFVAAAIAVGLLLAVGAVTWSQARHEVSQLGPVVGFLAAVLVLAACCEDEGVFRAAGGWIARSAGTSSTRLLMGVIALASVTTAILSLDTTVVLLTPVVIATVRADGGRPRPPLYVTAHLANSASLLLPVSNLTNLLAIAIVPLSFSRFAALMTLPWLVAIAVETVGHRRYFRADLAPSLTPDDSVVEALPVFATVVVVLTVVGFAVSSAFGLAPVWVAAAGALVLATRRVIARRTTVVGVFRETSPSFCLFVLGLGVVVSAVSSDGLATVLGHVVPSGTGLLALLAIAAVAAVLANLVNNLPATLLLVPVAASAGGVGSVLAVLVGVNIGPNLTYAGSLATLLWRRAVADVEDVPILRDFTGLGIMTVPAAVVGSTVALWLSLHLIGA